MSIETQSMVCLRRLNLFGTNVSDLDTAPLHHLVWIDIGGTSMVELDLRSCSYLKTALGCDGCNVLTALGVERDD